MRILKNSNFDFMSKKIFALGLSGLIVFAGIFSLLVNGGPKLSIDFKGGTLVAVQYNKDIKVEDVRSKMSNINIDGQKFDFSKEEVKYFGSKSAVSIRVPHIENSPSNFAQKIADHLFQSFPNQVPEDMTKFVLSKGKINYDEFMDMVSAAAPSIGHCNTMGTASSMNSVAEALGMSLPGCAVIPAPYREREQISFDTGKRIVGMVHEDLKPSKIMTRKAFENAVIVASAIGGSSNCTTHLTAIAKHIGIKFDLSNWQKLGHEIPLLVNCQPAGEYLMESFFSSGGVPAVMKELIKNKKIHTNIKTVTGKTVGENLRKKVDIDNKVIKTFKNALTEKAGFLVMRSNFFSSAIMKTSVISKEFKDQYLSNPKHPNVFECKAIVFEGPEDYHKRLNDKKLKVNENSILIIRGCGPVGYPGSAEVVNMQPPDRLLKKGIRHLPTLGDGRQSGTSESPSILHVSPESAVGGDLGIVKTYDKIKIDLNKRRVDLLISQAEFKKRRKNKKVFKPKNQTPWQEIFRNTVGQLDDGACINSRGKYLDVSHTKGLPRDSH